MTFSPGQTGASMPQIPTAAQRNLVSRLCQCQPPDTCRAGWLSLQLGLLFLSSSALIAGIGILLAITIWRPQRQPAPLSRPEARLLTALSLLMLIGTALSAKAGILAWLGLANWLPFFWFFLAIRPYVATNEARGKVAFWLCAATVPVVVMGLLQNNFGWDQQLNALGGLIRWPMNDPLTGTSLFDNPNVTGAWLAIVIPFAVSAALQEHQRHYFVVLSWSVSIGTAASLILSASRNSIVTLMFTLPAIGGRKAKLLPIITAALISPIVLGTVPEPLNQLMPAGLNKKLQQLDLGVRHLYARRDEIYRSALAWIGQHPWLGAGEHGFGSMYQEKIHTNLGSSSTLVITHSHSTPLEFGVSHGIPALLMLSLVVVLPVLGAIINRGKQNLSHTNRSWLVASVVVIWVNLWDITLFDSRLNMLGWLALAGLAEANRYSNTRNNTLGEQQE